ncbi:MAG: hypothetical protein AAF657_01935 [Acidobacteriota bacterium]
MLIHACAMFSDAFEIMVDRVIPSSRAALELIDRANRRGLSEGISSPYRCEIAAVLAEELEREDAEITAAISAMNQGKAKAAQAATLAHKASSAEKARLAAEYFLVAAQLETRESASRGKWARPDNSMNYVARAGIHLAQAGEFERAEPYLQQAIEFDWKAGRLWGDRHMVEWAFVCLLRHHASREAWKAFLSTWGEACARARQLDMNFPSIHPFQDELLTICVGNRLLEPLQQIIEGIESRPGRIKSGLKLKVARAKDLLA